MDIRGLDYNTHRHKLELPEYGREVQRMVEYAMTITDRRERQRCAETIVKIMQRVSPQMSRTKDSQHKYWDHLAVISNFQLDIDYPFDVEQAKKISKRPQPLKYQEHSDEVSHYGLLLFKSFDKLKQMPPREERENLVHEIAKQMWNCLKDYSQSTPDEEKVAVDLAYYTDGIIQLDPHDLCFTTQQHLHVAEKKKKKEVKTPKKHTK